MTQPKTVSRMFPPPVAHSALTSSITLPTEAPKIDLTDQPFFAVMLLEWGYEPIGVPWTGKQIIHGRVMDPEEVIPNE